MKWRAIARALHVSRNTVRRILTEQVERRERPHSALAAAPVLRSWMASAHRSRGCSKPIPTSPPSGSSRSCASRAMTAATAG
ncbi:MAG: hypothetical protein ACOX6T_10845 [Myxococcales bacterium]